MLFPDQESHNLHVERLNGELGLPTGLEQPGEPILFNTFAAEEDQFDMIREGWAATEAAIDRIHEAVAADSAQLIVLVVPHAHQLKHRFPRRERYRPYDADPRYAEDRLEAHLDGREIPLVKLIDVFEADLRAVVPYVDGHLSARAHNVVADMLAAEVARLKPGFFDPKIATALLENAERRRQGQPPRGRQKQKKRSSGS